MRPKGMTPEVKDPDDGIRCGNGALDEPTARQWDRGLGSGRNRHRRGRHDRGRRLHQPRLPGQGRPSGFSILLLWTVGGVVALCGVFAYSELGAMFPRSSGEYNFLGRAYHPAFGFLAGWISATVGFAAPVALAAMAFGEYGKSVVPGVSPVALAIGVVWLVSLIQLSGV